MDNFLTLNTGARMPIVGLGTWNAKPDKVGDAVKHAILECGYRHIDCAFVYHNEKEIGEALKEIFSEGKIKREEIFITSKLWCTSHRKEAVLEACKQTLADLKLDYLDLYLMHFPIAILPGHGDEPLNDHGYVLTENVSIRETWEAMENLVSLGLVKTIGVSNFNTQSLFDLLTYAKITPATNQIELHPYLQQDSLVNFCKHLGIVLTAYSPLGSYGASIEEHKPLILEDKHILDIAKKHKKTPGQILLRWAIQRGTIAIPKSTTPEHIRKNIEIFDFELSVEDLSLIKTLEQRIRFINPEEWWKIPFFD